MTEAPKVFAYFDSDQELVEACRRRADALHKNYEDIDELGNLAAGATNKVLALPQQQRFGPISRYAVPWALELRFALIEDPDTLRRVKRRADRAVRTGKSHASNAKYFARAQMLGRKGARKALKNLGPEGISKQRSKAAKSRWRKWRRLRREARKRPDLMRQAEI